MENSPFNGVPAEIRNHIFEYAVADVSSNSDGIHISDAQPAITRTCHQIRKECLLVFCANNTFYANIQLMPHEQDSVYETQVRGGLRLLLKWLKVVDKKVHEVVEALHIKIAANHPLVGRGVLSNERDWKVLARLLHKCDYEAPRLLVQIELSNDQYRRLKRTDKNGEITEELEGVAGKFSLREANNVNALLKKCGLDVELCSDDGGRWEWND